MNIHLHHADNLEIMATLPDESIDIICIDPPYLYLKNQKLERAFDEPKFFRECYRLLTKKGMIIMFGRGVSFYRWNTMIAEMVIDTKTGEIGFLQKDFYGNIISPPHHKSVKTAFKEEIIWDKAHCTSPLMNLSRVHETISIFTKKAGTINKVKIPYLEMKGHDIGGMKSDIKRLMSTYGNLKSMQAVHDFLDNNLNKKEIIRTDLYDKTQKYKVGESDKVKDFDRCVNVMQSVNFGLNEKSIIRTDRIDCDTFTKFEVNADKRKTGDRCVNVMQSVSFGLNEKSIIKQVRDHYTAIHPTQKPVRLLERLLNLAIPKDKEEITVADFFAGSGSCMEAVLNLQKQNPDKKFTGIATEIDEEYFEGMKNRIENLKEEPNLFSK